MTKWTCIAAKNKTKQNTIDCSVICFWANHNSHQNYPLFFLAIKVSKIYDSLPCLVALFFEPLQQIYKYDTNVGS